MKRTWNLASAAMLVVLTAAVGVGAQSSTTGDQQSSITVTGCLQPVGAGRSTVGTSGSSTAAASAAPTTAGAGSFMLVNARVGSAPGGGSGVTTVAPAGSGTNESAVKAGSTQPSAALSGAIGKNGEPDASASRTYALRGDNPELPRHVGQEVEISGRLVPSTAGASASSSATSAPSSGTPATASAAAGTTQTLEVRTIRMIASVCAAR